MKRARSRSIASTNEALTGGATQANATMIPDIDIHRSAWLMIRRYGEDAEAQAAMRGDELLAKGDLDGLLVWMAIIRAIERLQEKTLAGDEALH